MGWAMVMADEEDLMADGAAGETADDFVDEQGSTRKDLIAKARAYQGTKGYDGPSYWRTYNGANESGGWNVEETYTIVEPDVY